MEIAMNAKCRKFVVEQQQRKKTCDYDPFIIRILGTCQPIDYKILHSKRTMQKDYHSLIQRTNFKLNFKCTRCVTDLMLIPLLFIKCHFWGWNATQRNKNIFTRLTYSVHMFYEWALNTLNILWHFAVMSVLARFICHVYFFMCRVLACDHISKGKKTLPLVMHENPNLLMHVGKTDNCKICKIHLKQYEKNWITQLKSNIVFFF